MKHSWITIGLFCLVSVTSWEPRVAQAQAASSDQKKTAATDDPPQRQGCW